MRNWPEWLHKEANPAQIMTRRVEILSEVLGYEKTRIAAWGMSGIAMDAWLGIEENSDDEYGPYILRFAELLAPLT